jgi:hypothetical protein
MRINCHTQVIVAYPAAVESIRVISSIERAPHPHARNGPAAVRVEPEELARFEGEGGLEAPGPASTHPEEPSTQQKGESYVRNYA